ncbi:MAG: 4-hydroxy-tetrahydrodipicolinate synthase [Bacteroidetes bacterium]|nr:4-hydroxy-tetrahydrodipicolinate synthase [Bacteroidota bacterium]
MIQTRLKGTGVALVTPFNSKGEVDFKGLENLVNHCITGGVEYLVSLGTTGESATLTKEEKIKVLEFTIEKNSGRVPIVAGFGGNDTRAVAKELENFHFKGVDAVLSVSPYYNKPSQEGIFQHYKIIAAASPRPIILYNVPGRTSSNMKAETTLRLANEVKNIIGIKEASGDFIQCMKVLKYRPDNFLVVSGDDNITLGLMAYGMDGVISVAGQSFPKIFTEMVRQCLKGDFAAARMLHYQLSDITDMLFEEGNPVGVKCALAIQNICEDNLRLPLVVASDGLKKKLKEAISSLALTR